VVHRRKPTEQQPLAAGAAMAPKKGEPETAWPYEEPEVPALPAPYQLRSERVQVTEKEEVGGIPLSVCTHNNAYKQRLY